MWDCNKFIVIATIGTAWVQAAATIITLGIMAWLGIRQIKLT